MRTEAVRLLEDGRIEELAALLDGADGNQQTVDVLTKLAAQHNRQRETQSIAEHRYEIRWEKSTAAISDAEAGDGSAWLLIGDDADVVQPLVDALTAHGHRHQILGLPVSDADEEQLEAALRAAAAEEPALRILHLAALDSGAAPSMPSLPRMQHRVLGGTQRLFRAAVAAELGRPSGGDPRRATVTDADTVSPDQSCLWGFGRAASLEHPQLWGGLADLSARGARCRRMVAVDRPRGGGTARSAPGKTKSRCGTERSMFPGWFGGPGSRSRHRWHCAPTPRIW